MEKLEKKISSIINKSWKGEYGNSELDEKECSSHIASEVKDIAIAFENWKSKLTDRQKEKLVEMEGKIGYYHYVGISDDELWSDFITDYYK